MKGGVTLAHMNPHSGPPLCDIAFNQDFNIKV